MSAPLILVLDVAREECATFAALAGAVATRLEESGCVKPSWRGAVILREERFPTGLPLTPPAAIPHADREHTLRDAFVFARLEQPLAFGAMGDSDAAPLEVRLAVFIVAGMRTGQVEALDKLLGVLSDAGRRMQLEAGTAESARRALETLL